MQSSMNLSDRQITLIIILILALYPLVGMGIDLIAPSLPAISHYFQVSEGVTKNLITLYLLGYALGNFCIGFLSDTLGRRKLLITGITFFVLVSLLPIYFANIYLLLSVRFFQGFMIAGVAVIARAIFSDVLTTKRLMRTTPMLATMWGIGPIIGPFIGGYLQFYFNWQACFYFFAAFGFVGLIAIIVIIPETHFQRQDFNLKQLKNNFKTIVTHRIFIGSVILMGLTYSLLIVFNTLGPFLIQTKLGHSSIYFGVAALLMGVNFLVGTFICRYFIKAIPPEKIFSFAVPCFLFIALISVVFVYWAPKNILMILIPSLLMFLGCGIIYPTGMTKGLSLFRHLAGSSSAMMNLINILITTLTAFFMGYLKVESAISLVWVYFILMLLCGVVYFVTLGRRQPR